MRRIGAAAFGAALVATLAAAHIGSPNVLVDANAGPYPVRVIVRPPEVVPGLAEVIVRVKANDATGVSIRPVFWRTGARGAPSGDVLSLVAGEADVYSGHLWLMAYGSYSVYVDVTGARGAGTLIVPVNSFATGRLPLSPALGAILVVLGIALVAGLLTLIHAGSGESLVPPGQLIDRARRRKARRVTAIATPLLGVALFGGAAWWSAEDAAYRNFMFATPKAEATFAVDSTHRTLTLRVRDTASLHAILSPVAPDHGKMMHLFLVSRSGMQTFAHLHPVQTDSLVFTTEIPWLPAGRYLLYGDIVLENGLSLTVTTPVEIPAAPSSVTPSDSDDTWDRTGSVTPLVAGAGRALADGYSLAWMGAGTAIEAGRPTDLRFVVRDSLGNTVALTPYLGMAGHAVVVRHDGSVFIHLHPMGTVAPIAQQVFALRDKGDTTTRGRLRLENAAADPMTMTMPGALVFPYEFPQPGRYRLWVQVKPNDRVLTATFDVDVR